MVSLGLVRFETAGLPVFSQIGKYYLEHIESTIKHHMNKMSCTLIDAPLLQTINSWKKTGRAQIWIPDLAYSAEEFLLSPTCEESFTEILRSEYGSYLAKEKHVCIYQIRTKFRKELRSKGLLRTREFIMKDGYSASLNKSNSLVVLFMISRIYIDIFSELNIPFKIAKTDGSSMGDGVSYEFFYESQLGEGTYGKIDRKNEMGLSYEYTDTSTIALTKGVEIGHIFNFGIKYSKAFEWKINDIYPDMGSYGIGVSRLTDVLIDSTNNKVLRWNQRVCLFDIVLIARNSKDIDTTNLYFKLKNLGFNVMLINFKKNINSNFHIYKTYFSNLTGVWFINGFCHITLENTERVTTINKLIQWVKTIRSFHWTL